MQIGDEPPEDDEPRRLLEQMTLLSESVAESGFEAQWNWDDVEAADRQPHAYDPGALLVREAVAGDVVESLNRAGTFGDVPQAEPLETDSTRAPLELMRVLLPPQEGDTDEPDDRVRRALDLLEGEGLNSAVRELEDDAGDRGESDDDDTRPLQDVAPDHWIHLAPTGAGRICPATEPAETGRWQPWPKVTRDPDLGRDVTVVVIDSGWHTPAGDANGPTPWLSVGVGGELDHDAVTTPLGHYAGHGTFIAGIVKCLAPATTVHVLRFMAGHAIRESDMVVALRRALDDYAPQLISLSAGAVTRRRRRPLSFELFWRNDLRHVDNCHLVAAAGNDGVTHPMWPAAFRWATGVGSLDHDGRVSSFSNHGEPPRVDVYAVGRNLVSAYPDGRYVCRESPDRGETRYFHSGMARWSGTSFSTPVVVGMIAAEMTRNGGDVSAARDTVVGGATAVTGPTGAAGPTVKALMPPYS
jgi:Subtilase family